jgi:hypothetical protein
MSSPRKELQEVEAVLLNITDAIGRSFISIDRKLRDLLDKLYENNQKLLQQNQLATLQGDMRAVPTQRFNRALETSNKEAIERNEEIKVARLSLRQIQEKSPASSTDAEQAKALDQKLNDLDNQNAQLLKVQEALLKSTFVTGQADADKELSRQTLSSIQDEIGTGIYRNNVLKSKLQEERLYNLGITLKTGTSAEERKPEQPIVKSGPKIK